MRTGAIFARGSCKALMWMALTGVVFALGVGSALAQPALTFTPTVEEVDTEYSKTIVTIKVTDTNEDPVKVWGDVNFRHFTIAGNNVVTDTNLPATSPGVDTFEINVAYDVRGGTDTLAFDNPDAPADGSDDPDERMFTADDGATTDANDDPDAIADVAAVAIAEAINFPALPTLPNITVEVGTEYDADMPVGGSALPEATPNSGVGMVEYMLSDQPAPLSLDDKRNIIGTPVADDVGPHVVTYTATDTAVSGEDPERRSTHRTFTITVMAALELPGKPQNLAAEAGDGQVTLSWMAPPTTGDDSGGAVESYEYRQDAVGDWMDAGTGLTKTVMDLTNDQSYLFQVRAKNRKGPGPETDGVRATPMADDEPLALPGKPRNLTAKAGNGEVTLSWMAPAAGDGGAVAKYQYDMAASGDWKEAGTGLTKTVMDLTNGTTYIFRVRAHNATGPGDPTDAVSVTPTSTSVDDPVTVKEVKAAASVDEAGGLEVTVTANVPAGTKVDGKVAPIASKMVMVETMYIGPAGTDANDRSDIDLLGTTGTGYYEWKKIPRTEKASTPTFTFRVAIGQDLNAEDEKFKFKVTIDGAAKESKEIKINDSREQDFELKLPDKAKGKITEGADPVTLTLTAKPKKTYDIPVTLALNPNDPSKYELDSTSGTFGTGSFSTTIKAKADKNRAEDTVTVSAYTTGTLGNDVKLKDLEIPVTDINALPAVMATIVDGKGEAVSPKPESVMEGETVKIMLTAVDKDGEAMKAAENLTIMLMPTGTADSADYRLSPNSIEIPKDKDSSSAVDLMVTKDQNIEDETLTFDAVVSGEAKNGTEKKSVMGVLSLMIEDGTMKLVWAKTQEEVEAAVYAAKNAAAGDDEIFSVGDPMIEIMGSALFSSAEGVTVSYTAESDMSGVASTSVSGGTVMVTAAGEGMAHITITAHAGMSGVKIADQTDPGEASIVFPVEVGLEALSIMLSGPEDENIVEGGMGAMVTATANRAVTADTMVMLMRDRAKSSATDADYTAEAITIAAGEMMGSTMVMAVEDNMMETVDNMPEELVLYGMTEGMAGEVTGEVHLHLWDAAVPALPVIAQFLLAAFLAFGGYRRYRRR